MSKCQIVGNLMPRLIWYISVRRPSLDLFPAARERRFSRVGHDRLGSITEVPEKFSIEVRREMFTQLDIDDKYVEEDEKPPFSSRMKKKLRCTRSRLYHLLVYVFPIIAVLKNYQPKKFTLGMYAKKFKTSADSK